MSWLDLGQMIAHGFAKLTGAQRDAGADRPVAATESGGIVLPDGTEMLWAKSRSIGLGITPNDWSHRAALQIQGAGSAIASCIYSGGMTSNGGGVGSNCYFDGSTWKYVYSGSYDAGRYESDGGSHTWYTAPPGTAGNPISFTQAMTLDASSNLTVAGQMTQAKSAPAGYTNFTVENTAANGYSAVHFNAGPAGANGKAEIGYAPGIFFAIGPTVNDTATPIVFRNNNATEHVRIDTSGNLLMSGGGSIAFNNNTSARPGASGQYIIAADSGGLYQQAGGSYYLVTTAGGSTSDASLKTNVTPLARALERVEAIRGVNFEFIEQPLCAADQGIQLGVIAQEVEAQFPEIVLTGKDGTKTVRYDRLVAPLIEAVKELSAQNRALMARVAALESA